MSELDYRQTSEQLYRVLSRPQRSTCQGSHVSTMKAAFTNDRASRQKIRVGNFWPFILALCEAAEPSIVVEFILVIKVSKLFKVDLVPQECSNPTKTLHKLVSFARFI